MNKRKTLGILAGAGVTAALAYSLLPVANKNKKSAVKDFEVEKYLGKWYEIARLDFYFEKGLDRCTATYSLNKDGSVRVENVGYDTQRDKWKQSIGKAKFCGRKTEARLKVSFFGPFYAAYNVIDIDKDYKYALVAGKNTDYLWILSRERNIPADTKEYFLIKARSMGFPVEKLVWNTH